MAMKKSTRQKTAKKRVNDALRAKLVRVMNAIDDAHRSARALNHIKTVRNALPLAIQQLKDNPGPVQKGGG